MIWTADARPHPAAMRTLKYAASIAVRKCHAQTKETDLVSRWKHEITVAVARRRIWWLALAGAACCANGGFCPTALGPLVVCFGDASVDIPLLDRHVAMRRDRIKAWMAYAERVPALWPTPGSVLRFFKPAATEAKKGE